MPKKSSHKPYKAVKEVKRRARLLQGQARPSKVYTDRRKKPPKHSNSLIKGALVD